jgi:hypothetical protein
VLHQTDIPVAEVAEAVPLDKQETGGLALSVCEN